MGKSVKIDTLDQVLIDTWWNVNSDVVKFTGATKCFNRYMVECKSSITLYFGVRAVWF